MGKTYRKYKTSDRISEKNTKEIKNSMEKPMQTIKISSSPNSSSVSRDRTMSHVKMGNVSIGMEKTRPIEEITLNNIKTDSELNLALKTIKNAARKIEYAQKSKKYNTWTTADEDYTLPIDSDLQHVEIEDSDISRGLEATNASDWEDFPTKGMPILRSGIEKMSIKNKNKKVTFNQKSLKSKIYNYKNSQKESAIPKNNTATNTEFPIKKSLLHANKSQTAGTILKTKTMRPTYSSEQILGYSAINPKTHSRATYYSIQKNPTSVKQNRVEISLNPKESTDIEHANRQRTHTMAYQLRVIEGNNGLYKMQKAQHTQIVNKVFKSRRHSAKDPALKRVHPIVKNRVAMNERAKEPKYSSTYKRPLLEE